MHGVVCDNAGVVKLLLKRGADGTMTTTQAARGMEAGSTALDIARLCADSNPRYAETLAVLRLRCCGKFGITSSGLSATAAAGGEQRLKHCALCPAGAPARSTAERSASARTGPWVCGHGHYIRLGRAGGRGWLCEVAILI